MRRESFVYSLVVTTRLLRSWVLRGRIAGVGNLNPHWNIWMARGGRVGKLTGNEGIATGAFDDGKVEQGWTGRLEFDSEFGGLKSRLGELGKAGGFEKCGDLKSTPVECLCFVVLIGRVTDLVPRLFLFLVMICSTRNHINKLTS